MPAGIAPTLGGTHRVLGHAQAEVSQNYCPPPRRFFSSFPSFQLSSSLFSTFMHRTNPPRIIIVFICHASFIVLHSPFACFHYRYVLVPRSLPGPLQSTRTMARWLIKPRMCRSTTTNFARLAVEMERSSVAMAARDPFTFRAWTRP